MNRLRATMIATAVATACCGEAWAARIDYTLDAGIEDNDNVALAPTDPISQRYLRGGLGFLVNEDVSALQLSLNGRVEYRDYRDDVFNDTVDGTLLGRLNWAAIPDRLSFSAEDSLTVQPVDALAPNAPGNRQQVNVVSLGPTLLFDWTRSLRGRAELRYVNSNAEVTDEFNSNHLTLALGATREFSPTSALSLLAQTQRVDFDNDAVARDYHRYDLYARYERKLAHFDLGLDAGYSRIDYRRGAARTDPLLRADLRWSPTTRSVFIAEASSEFSDTASDSLRAISAEASTSVPDQVLTGNAVINASPFVVHGFELDYEFSGARFGFGVGGFSRNRNYVDADNYDQRVRGLRANVQWTIRPSLVFGAHVTRDRLEYTSLLREDRTLRTGATLRYRLARRWSMGLDWERYKRDSTAAGQTVAQNIVYLSISYSNR